MSEESARLERPRERVGVYFDFENIVISRYNQLHGEGAFAKDKVRNRVTYKPEAEVTTRIRQAMVDVDAILDYAATFGPITVSRAYADWSTPVNARHQRQLVDHAVDLIQLFPAVAALKNGADIRLAIDVMEDLFRHDNLTHIVIVAGDSDYIPLAQRCRRLDRVVIGIGVSGATSSALASACDVFTDYDSIPGTARSTSLTPPTAGPISVVATKPATPKAGAKAGAKAAPKAGAKKPPGAKTIAKNAPAKRVPALAAGTSTAKTAPASTIQPTTPTAGPVDIQRLDASPKARKAATALLLRAVEQLASNDQEWQHASAVKSTMRQLDPVFQEGSLGFSQFADFLKSRHQTVEIKEQTAGAPVLLKLRS
ncbi:NYN domain-containing protein [Cryobacterium mannosilyticum]|uniref:NYN domain-containing protein n=1 Tax=Cryobacterium mannosilyticum TaxID=1259190 RepID=A0A4R8W8I7_9MICO|nr:NYN domain-containing protein [Cryobacterium mannosilyticum]TFC02637.1 NYN domain-containing protein [Cryobacterium mannosilyticum]